MQEFLGFRFEIISNPRNKNSYIRINPNGNLIFTYPSKFRDKLGHTTRYIRENQESIKKHYQQLLIKEKKRHKNLQEYVSQYLYNHPNTLIIFNKPYDVATLNIESLSQILYEKSYKILCEMANSMQLEFKGLSISYAKSYLGQCHRKHIKIDYRNVLCNEDLLYYLIIHELSHIRYPNHSKNFWAEVGKHYPHYKSARKEIKSLATCHTEILRHYHLLPKKLQ